MTTSRATNTFLAMLLLFHPWLAFAQQAQQSTAAQQAPWEGSGPWHMWHGDWTFWWVFPLFMLLMIAGCLVVFFFGHKAGCWHAHRGPWHVMDRSPYQGHSWGDPTYSALALLNERFAKGEIPREEYEDKKAAIQGRGRP